MVALDGLRVIDLTDQQGAFCGKLLADLGAEVIKVESPKGCPSRSYPPFVKDSRNGKESIPFLANNINKLGITLDLTNHQGQEVFLKLVAQSDLVIESFMPGKLAEINLDYHRLSKVKPDLILTSITPFGQSGPYRDYQACDLVALALSGFLFIIGDSDRPSVRLSIEQAFAYGSLHGAIGSLMALRFRDISGCGNHVDVSIQEALVLTIPVELAFYEAENDIARRSGPRKRRGHVYCRDVWPCKDGQIGWRLLGGKMGAGPMNKLVKWMDQEDMAGTLKKVNWLEVDMNKVSQAELDGWTEQLENFFITHSKEEIYERALKDRILMSPAYNAKELLEYTQLIERDFWKTVDHPELGRQILYPGPFGKLSGTPIKDPQRAPHLGEHNRDVYVKLLGLTDDELENLIKGKII